MLELNFLQSAVRDLVDNMMPKLSFDDVGAFLVGYVIVWIVVRFIGMLLSDLRDPDTERELSSAKANLKDQEIEIMELRRTLSNDVEREQLMRNYQELQQRLEHEQRLVKSLREGKKSMQGHHMLQQRLEEEQKLVEPVREQLVDPEVLGEKDQMIEMLATGLEQLKKENDVLATELEQLKKENDISVFHLHDEIDKLSNELEAEKQGNMALAAENSEFREVIQLHKQNADDLMNMLSDPFFQLFD